MNIKSRTYYFYNGLIDIKDFDAKLLKLDKKNISESRYLLHWLCHKKPEYKINCVNPLYLLIDSLDGFIEEKEGDKHLTIAFTGRNTEVLKNMQKFGVVNSTIRKINHSELGEYDKDYMKIKFNSDDDTLLNKELYFPTVTVII